MLLLIGIMLSFFLFFSIIVNADNEHKEIKTPILDQSVVPGYYLGYSELDESWDEIMDDANVKGRFFLESWTSIPRDEISRLRKERIREIRKLREKGIMDKNIKKHLRKSPLDRLKNIAIRIVIFKSRKEASKWAIPYLKSLCAAYNPTFKEGTLCGEKIGEKCWVSGGKLPGCKSGVDHSLSVKFLKNNFLVQLSVIDPEGIDESFALRVAKNIAEKL